MSQERQTERDRSSGRPKDRSPKITDRRRSLKDITTEPPDLAEYMDLLDEVGEHPDRAVAIILAAMVEGALRAAILARMVPLCERREMGLFGPDSPLGTFSAKIKVGFALGVYGPETRADLDTVRAIRNAFAHCTKPIKFDTPEVAAECAKLRIPRLASPDDIDERPWPPESPRNQYNAATRLLCTRLRRCAAKYKLPPPARCPCLV
jgi:hypothetical protein